MTGTGLGPAATGARAGERSDIRPDAVRVLVIEDDDTLRAALEAGLSGAGYRVDARPDGTDLDEIAGDFRPELAVLDVMVPGVDGFRLAHRLRSISECAVVFLTARDDVADRLHGFDSGADDYLVKPFVMAELLARIRAVLRRAGHLREPVVQISDLVVDENTGEASRAGSFLSLTATEFRLLAFLARHPGRVLSKAQILSQVWGYDAYDPNLVEAFVSALRRKIEAHGPRLIHTVRGVGYRIGEPRTDPADGTTS